MKHRRLLLCADLQIDEDVATSLPGTTPGMTRRLEDRLVCWDWVLSVAKEKRCSLIAILGDVFDDRHSVTLPCLHAFTQMLTKAKATGVEVMITIGNHDSHLRHAAINSVSPFSGLADVISKPSLYDGMAVVPWAEGIAYRRAVARLAGKCDVMLSHKLLTGAITGVQGEDASIYDGVPRTFLGDVHEPMEVSDSVDYVGSWMQLDFRDALTGPSSNGGRRGVIVYDRREKRSEYVRNDVSPKYYLYDFLPHVEGAVEFKSLRPIDHVRCTVPIPLELFAKVKASTASVECPPQPDRDVKPRSDISADMSDKRILRRYLKAVNKYTPKRLRGGLSIMKTA